MKAQRWRCRIDRRRIAYLKFVVESYDNLALVTTVDAAAGIVEVQVPPGLEETVRDLLTDLAGRMLIQPLGPDRFGAGDQGSAPHTH